MIVRACVRQEMKGVSGREWWDKIGAWGKDRHEMSELISSRLQYRDHDCDGD